jgi:hypothetical protein
MRKQKRRTKASYSIIKNKRRRSGERETDSQTDKNCSERERGRGEKSLYILPKQASLLHELIIAYSRRNIVPLYEE